MKSSFAVLALSAIAAAAPTAAPAKFALSVTSKLDGKETSLYLKKGATGAGTTDIKDAASCSINEKTNLVCDGQTIGAPNLGVDMTAIKGVKADAKPENIIVDGFSVVGDAVQWQTKNFEKLGKDARAGIFEKQGGKAQWGFFRSILTGNQVQLYTQLGCPGGTHGGAHEELIVGSNKITPL